MRDDLPTGTVTFLFTDVEGSTKLLHSLGAEGYADALAEHRRVIREACAAEGGVEVDTQGDAFFFAFPTAPGALAAASALHGCACVRADPGPGRPAHRNAASHRRGLRRETTSTAPRASLPAATAARCSSPPRRAQLVERELRDLGEHRLKDLSAPERVYQLGDGDFPALKVPLPHEPACARDALPRPRAGTGRGRRAPRRRRHSPAHAHRPRRHREDAARAAGSRPRFGCLPRRRVLDPARAASRSHARARDSGSDARIEERPRRAHFRQGDALPLRQLRAGRGCRD